MFVKSATADTTMSVTAAAPRVPARKPRLVEVVS